MDTLCTWKTSDDDYASAGCSFNQNIGNSFMSTLIITAIVNIVTVPFDLVFLIMVRRVKDFAQSAAMGVNVRLSLSYISFQ